MPTITPTKPQFDYITASEPFPAMVAGFGAGKTDAAVNRSIIGKLKYPTLNRGFYEPTYDLIRMIAFPRFEEALTNLSIPYKLFKSPLNYISIERMGNIYFRSMDVPARIIGYEHADADVDELDTLKPDIAADVWRRVLSRNRQKKPDGMPNTIGVTTTPEGFRFVYKTWKKEPKKGYKIIQAPTSSNPHLPDGYIKTLEDIYPSQLLSAYLNGDFVNLTSGNVYTNFDRLKNHTNETIKENEPLHIGMDFNVNRMAAIIHVIRDGNPLALAELTKISDTPAMIKTIKDRYPKNSITIYPDASGQSRKTINSTETDHTLLRQAGFVVLVNPTNPAIRDRVMSMNAMFMSGNGKRLYLVNTDNCPVYSDLLERQAYDKNGDPEKDGTEDPIDAGGYFIAHRYAIAKRIATAVKLTGK